LPQPAARTQNLHGGQTPSLQLDLPPADQQALLAAILDFARDIALETRFSGAVPLYGSVCNQEVRGVYPIDSEWPGSLRYVGGGNEVLPTPNFRPMHVRCDPNDPNGRSAFPLSCGILHPSRAQLP
jgi:hypothetical protein